MMVKDKFTKYIVSITTSTVCTVEAIAGLFDLNMLKYIEVPPNIVTDRDVRLTSRLWTTLFNLIGTKLKFFIINHPQINR
jgi:hypothetical protein